jgi:hypothetical protein
MRSIRNAKQVAPPIPLFPLPSSLLLRRFSHPVPNLGAGSGAQPVESVAPESRFARIRK